MISTAFFNVCKNAELVDHTYLSLYKNVPYYGGPEEGGWWSSDTLLVASQQFPTEELAEQAKEQVENLVAQYNNEERKLFAEHCLRQTEWLEQRGLDDNFLGEVDGETKFFVVIEQEQGGLESYGPKHYE